jgi:hypothetical protein
MKREQMPSSVLVLAVLVVGLAVAGGNRGDGSRVESRGAVCGGAGKEGSR